VFSHRRNSFSFRGLHWLTFSLSLSLFLAGCATVSSTPHPLPSQAVLSLSATSFNFNTVTVGKAATQTLHITNTGTAPLTISSLTLKSQQFSITGPAVPRTVLPSQEVDYTVSFVPTQAGSLSASLQIATNAEAAPAAVSLAGTGQSAYATLQVTPAAVSFGSLKLQTTATQNVTLKNTGDINMTVNGVTVTGAGFGYSSLSPGYTLPPNKSVTFQVWFKPQTVGAASGTVTILSANIASPEEIPLTGSATNPSSPPPTQPVQHTVSLSWQPSNSPITGYRVYRSSVSGTDFIPLTATVTSLQYTDNTVASGNTYYYVVTAVDSSGSESPYSNQATAVIPSP